MPEVIPPASNCCAPAAATCWAASSTRTPFVRIDANQILRKLLTLRGVHNYHPRHLIQALDFVLANRKRFPFHDLVDGKYKLDQVGQAMKDAAERKVLRAAIVP